MACFEKCLNCRKAEEPGITNVYPSLEWETRILNEHWQLREICVSQWENKAFQKGKITHFFNSKPKLTSKTKQNEQPCQKQGYKPQLPRQVNRAFGCRCSEQLQRSGHGETPSMNWGKTGRFPFSKTMKNRSAAFKTRELKTLIYLLGNWKMPTHALPLVCLQ